MIVSDSLKLSDELVIHIRQAEDLLLGDAEQVVIERRGSGDGRRSLLNISGAVDDRRRVAGTGSDDLLTGGHQGLDHAGSAGTDQQSDLGSSHDDIQGLHGGLSGHRGQVAGTAGLHDSLID